MKRFFWVSIIILQVLTVSGAQAQQAADAKPKFLAANKASAYLNFTVEHKDDIARISIESMEDVSNHTFYILKGERTDRADIHWEIIAVYENHGKKSIHKTYTDQDNLNPATMYRIMVKDEAEKIEYTNVISLIDIAIPGSMSGI